MMKLDESYNREDFLNFLTDFVPDFEKDIRRVDTDRLRVVQSGSYLGRSRKLNLTVFELSHKVSSGARVSLATDGFQIMKQSASFQALVIYFSPESDDWRISLMTLTPEANEKGGVSIRLSNPRRYSFFLGPDAKVNTPTRFLIKEGRIQDFNDLISRFNVEIVTKEFFGQYKDLFERLSKYLSKDHAFQVFASRNGIDTNNFTKKLLGQIVFLYFLQRKGWLGAKRGEHISNGEKNFMRNYFNRARMERKHYFNDFLEPLFYSALNQRPDKAGSFYRDEFGCQIPFLNGGLFEPINNYKWQEEFLHIPDEIFSSNPDNPEQGNGILDIFDLYNFTVDESDPTDKEVSVDPEMLGKVFENLLEENLRQGKGTYYTPREIVNYMCEESLINYLAAETGLSINDIHKQYFPSYNTLGDEEFAVRDVGISRKIIESLKSIKVVDPACGSGAFLVGMLQRITILRLELEQRMKLLGESDVNPSDYTIKKETIQNCIYGVDIDPSAIDIAKLRLWLSLVVDYDLEEIEPLPNLDYKIMQGNSLLEELVLGDTQIKLFDYKSIQQAIGSKRMKNLFEEDQQVALFDDVQKEQILKNMKSLQLKYFSQSDAIEKKKIRGAIEKIEHELIETSVKTEVENLNTQRINIRTIPGIGLLPEDIKRLDKISSKENQILAVLDELKRTGTKPFFLWHLHFADVFEEKGGFDVVIANPPYGADINKNEQAVLKKKLVDTKNNNSAAVFIDFGKNVLLNENGTLSYIVPKSLLFSELWFDLVKALIGKVSILVDVEKAFEKVLLEQVVFLYGQSASTDSYYARKFLNNEFIRSTQILNETVSKFKAWLCDVTPSELNIAQRVLDNPKITLLSGISETKRGIGLQKYLKPIGDVPAIGGKNIFRYGFSGCKGYLLNKDLSSNKSKLAFMNQPKIMSQNIVAHVQNPNPHLIIIAAYDERGEIITLDTVNNTIVNSEYDPKYILAIMNSSFISWYAYRFIYCAAIRTMHFDSYYVGKIPILKIDKEKQKDLVDIVNKIMKVTKSKESLSNPDILLQVKEYSKQIDQIVYKLYDLTPEEIKVVEGN